MSKKHKNENLDATLPHVKSIEKKNTIITFT